MNVVRHNLEIAPIRVLAIDHHCLVAALKHMPAPSTPPVPPLAHHSHEPFHARYQIRLRGFQQDVENLPAVALREGWVIPHLHPGVNPPPILPTNLAQTVQPVIAILVFFKDLSPV